MNMLEGQMIQGKLCFTSAISQVLLNNKINISEETIFGLGFGLSFRLYTDETGNYIDQDCVNLVTDYKQIDSFLKDCGIKIYEHIYGTKKEFEKLIRSNAEKSILVAIDTFYLPYSNTFHKIHDAHILVLTYFSEEKIILQDTYVSALVPQKQMYTVSLSELLSWCKIVQKNSDRYYLWSFEVEDYRTCITKQYFLERVMKLTEGYLFPENTSVRAGTEGLLYFCKLIRQFGEINLADSKQLIAMHEKISANGGLYQTRMLYGLFLKENDSFFEYDRVVQKLAVEFEIVANKWRNISAIILKATLKREVPEWRVLERKVYKTVLEEIEMIENLYLIIEQKLQE